MSQFFKTREETAAWLDEMGVQRDRYIFNGEYQTYQCSVGILRCKINDDLTVDVRILEGKDLKFKYNDVGLCCEVAFKIVNDDMTVSKHVINLADYERNNWNNYEDDYAIAVDLYDRDLTHIPVQFGIVDGTFKCNGNRLETLKGAPKKVGRHFRCDDNQLTSLEGSPEKVGGYFLCDENPLRDVGAWRDHQVSDVSGFRGPSEEEVAKNKAIYERELLSKVAEQATIERPVTPVRSRVM